MVRPHLGPPRFKPRPHLDGYNNMLPQDHHGPHSRSQRGFRGPPGKAPPSWRDNRGAGRPHFTKRPPLMGERREQPANQWRSSNQDCFHPYPSQMEPHHGHRRPSPSRPNRPPPPQHRSSPQSPAPASPGQRGAPFHGHHSPSPRHYHSQPPDRRPAPTPSPHGSFRGLHRRPPPPREEERSWGPRRQHSLRDNVAPEHGGRRWNGRGGFSHPHGGERGPSGPPHRKPREFHGRGPYPERWSAERDPRKQHGEVGREREREGSGHRSGDWPQEGSSPHHPPYRSPSWKGGPPQSSSSYHNSPQERPGGPPPPRKRSFPEHGVPPADPGPEQRDHLKRPRRETPHVNNGAPKGFGGKPLSFRDKSRILKGRKMRAESVVRLRAPPPRPRCAEIKTSPKPPPEEESSHRSTLAMRKERFQDNAAPLRRGLNKTVPRQSPASPEDNASKSSKESHESAKEQVESHRALREHSPSPLDRLTRDLVVVSQWQAAPHSSSDDRSPSRERTSKTKTERYFNSDRRHMLNERFSKTQDSSTSPKEQRGRYSDMKNQRPAEEPEESNRPGRPFRKPGPPQRPVFRPGPRRTFPDPAGQFRKPLMGTFVPRPFPSQKPGFRKSQTIMSKYRNMQTLRQRVPYQRGSHHRRW